MRLTLCRIAWLLAISIPVSTTPEVLAAQPAARLKIIVIEGEASVNVIQQKTAVAPIIEVRDQNDQPVAGAVVKFAIKGGKATFSGAKTITVTTNAAGRATAAGLTPTGNGAVQISASATFQGQSAAAAIAQTNVATAAEAAGGGAAAGGGGLSLTTIGIVGGAVAAGAVVTTQALGAGGETFTGTFSGPMTMVFAGASSRTETFTGELKMILEISSDGVVTGTAEADGTEVTGADGGPFAGRTGSFHGGEAPVNGTTANMTASHDEVFQSPPSNIDPVGNINTLRTEFSGALNAGVITGTLRLTQLVRPTTPLPGQGPNAGTGSGTVSYPMTLR